MKILVTGGSGFIGSHVVDVLAARGHTPVIFDRVESPHHAPGSVETVRGEVTDSAVLGRAMEGCDAVIHLAAMADVGDVKEDPEGAELANSRGTIAVLEAARRTAVTRVVYGSTIWVYSDCEETAVDESTLLAAPGHLYTATKLAGELYCRSYAELYGVEYTVLRFGIPYGPRARPAAVVPMFVNKALAGEALTVAGDGSQGRRFVYVEDLADGIVRGLAPVAANRVYNLAGSETTTILDIAQTVQALIGDTEIVHTPARAGDFGGKEVSSVRARDELGWETSTPFAEGVRRYVAWRRALEPAPAEPVEAPAALAGIGAVGTFSPARPAPALAGAGAVAALTADPHDGALPLARVGVPRAASRFLREGRALFARVADSVRMRRARPAISAMAVTGAFFWSFATDESFSFLAKVSHTKPQTSASTARPEVGLLVRAPEHAAPAIANELNRSGAHASFALEGSASRGMVTRLQGAGSDAIPQLRSGELFRWLGTRGELRRTVRRLGLSGHVYYALPRNGFTFGQDVLGHTAGATPVAGAVHLQNGSERGRLHRGAVVEVSLPANPSQWRPVLDRLLVELRGEGLAAKPADMLLRQARPAHR